MLTLDDLGIVRTVREDGDRVRVEITPTYSGCPALEAMRADIHTRLRDAGYREVEVVTVYSPPWSTDWISAEGRRRLAEHGIAPPGPADPPRTGPVPLRLEPPERPVECPRCRSHATTEISRFGSTACQAIRRCTVCAEPFAHVKEL